MRDEDDDFDMYKTFMEARRDARKSMKKDIFWIRVRGILFTCLWALNAMILVMYASEGPTRTRLIGVLVSILAVSFAFMYMAFYAGALEAKVRERRVFRLVTEKVLRCGWGHGF